MAHTEQKGTTARSPRHSRSAAASLAREIERLRAMSVEERIHAALSMDRRFSWLKPARRES